MIRLAIIAALIAGPALADPCHAIPDKGPMLTWLHKGVTFSGPAVYVGDGDSLCIDVGTRKPLSSVFEWGSRPTKSDDWVEVRLADFYAPELHDAGGREAKTALERIVRGKRLTCVAEHRGYDRMVATCRIDGVSIGDRMRRAGVIEGGRGR